VGYGTVVELLRRASAAGLSWEGLGSRDDEELEAQLYPPVKRTEEPQPPDFSWACLEMKKKGVTLRLLWEEYRSQYPNGYGYSWFCDEYRSFAREQNVVLRQHYKAGEQMQVDWAGQTVPIRDRETGEERPAYVFVACLSASQLTYCEACLSQKVEDWVAAHVRALEYFGGVPEIVVPDNTKTAITKACRYEPEENPTYAELAQHYGMAVIPTRVRKPRDKAKVENAVLQVERGVLAPLRNVTFFAVADLNLQIGERRESLNNRDRSDLGMSRRELFEKTERATLRPLPAERFQVSEQKKVRVGPDYHVEFDRHYYSVPYQLARQELYLKATGQIVELFNKGRSVAQHVRVYKPGHSTIGEHMPKAHQEFLSWTPKRLVSWARKSGAATSQMAEQILGSRLHPQQGFRACLGLIRLGKKYGDERLEAACSRALQIKDATYKSVQSILQKGLDQRPSPEEGPTPSTSLAHANVRGAAYYAGGKP
jgi:transposase